MTYLERQRYQDEISREGLYDCAKCCTEEIDPIDSTPHTVGGETVCQQCVVVCDDCGEYIDDENKGLGPMVRYRRWEMNGKLSDGSHALCAADVHLGDLKGEKLGEFYAEHYTRGEIAAFVAGALAEVTR